MSGKVFVCREDRIIGPRSEDSDMGRIENSLAQDHA